MKKKATALAALISMCVIVTAGIGAVSASDEPVAGITMYKINPDGTTTPIKTFEGSGPMVVTATMNEDGSMDMTKEDRRISEDELCGGLGLDNCPNIHKVTPETELPVNIEDENGGITAGILNPSEKIDASPMTTYYQACAWNNVIGWSCCAYSYNYNGGAGAEASDGYVSCWYW